MRIKMLKSLLKLYLALWEKADVPNPRKAPDILDHVEAQLSFAWQVEGRIDRILP